MMEDTFREQVRRKAIVALIAHEVNLLTVNKSRDHTKILRYFNSTPTREYFAKLMVHARFTQYPYSVSRIAEILSISRVAANSMVNECISEGWVEAAKGDRGARYCMASQELEDLAEEWFDTVLESVNKYNIGVFLNAAGVIDDVTELP